MMKTKRKDNLRKDEYMTKYMELVVKTPGCVYIYNGKKFRSIYDAISKAVKDNSDCVTMKRIDIVNRKAPNIFISASDASEIEKHETRYHYSRLAKNRTLYFAHNMSEVYLETFELRDLNKKNRSYSFLYDYGYIYSDHIELDESKKYRSSIFPYTLYLNNNVYNYSTPHSKFSNDDVIIACNFEYDMITKDSESVLGMNYGYRNLSIPVSTLRYQEESESDIGIGYNIDPYTLLPKQKKRKLIFKFKR